MRAESKESPPVATGGLSRAMHHPPRSPVREDAWGVTFAFWGTLLVSAGLLATVALAPKLLTISDLDAQYASNQLRLVELERRAIELERVAEALEHDPAFAAELAKSEFAAGGTGGERIAVSDDLRLGAADTAVQAAAAVPKNRWVLPRAALEPIATRQGLRGILLTTSAISALLAFLLLNDAQAATLRRLRHGLAVMIRGTAGRYARR